MVHVQVSVMFCINQSNRSSVTSSDGIEENISAVPRRHHDKRLPSLYKGRGEYSMSGRRHEVIDNGGSGQ